MSDVQKKRIRAGHRAASTGIIAQVRDTLQASEKNYSRLKQQLQALKDKLEVLWSLDAEILNSVAPTEEDESLEIEGADIVREEIEVAVIDIETALEREKCFNATTLERKPGPSSSVNQVRTGRPPRTENVSRPTDLFD